MHEPKKPSYSEEEINEINKKIDDYNIELYDVNLKNKYINDNLPSFIKSLKIIKRIINWIMKFLRVIIIIFIFCIALYYILKEFGVIPIEINNMGDIFLLIVVFFLSVLCSVASILLPVGILDAIISLLEGIFNTLFKKIEEEDIKLNNEYHKKILAEFGWSPI